VTYPNLLILDYLNTTKLAAPETQMKAESYVGTGYQRLLTFETDGGGFSLFGGGQADTFLSAYGLLQLSDMAHVYPVDPKVAERTAQWLLAQQEADGSWRSRDYRAGQGGLGMTAFVTWALADAGHAKDPAVAKALSYIRGQVGQASPPAAEADRDAYTLALVANALVAADPKGAATGPALDQLAALAQRSDQGAYWPGEDTMMGGYGKTGSVETTALAVHVLLRGAHQAALAKDALAFIVQSKDPQGTWGSTQATIWSLKALLLSATAGDMRDAQATVQVALNGGAPQAIEITPENADVVRILTFEGEQVRRGANSVALTVAGQGSLMYQVTADYYLPWEAVPPQPEAPGLMSVELSYDRTMLAVDDLVTVSVLARLTREGTARMVVLDLGVPPGFSVQSDDLNALVERGTISRYDLTGRQIIVYMENMSSEAPLSFRYRLRARFPLRAKTQQSSAYDYYNPDQGTIEEPVLLTVTGG